MNPICSLRQRALARYAVLDASLPIGSRLAAHVARCPHCRRNWQELSRLARDLPQALPAPKPSAAFLGALTCRLAPARCRRLALRPLPLLAGLAVAGVLAMLCFTGWRRERAAHFGPERAAHIHTPTRTADAPLQRGPVASRRARVVLASVPDNGARARRRSGHRRYSYRLAYYHRWRAGRRRGAIMAGAPVKPTRAAVLTAAEQARLRAERWCAWGAWYEDNQDYRQAADAFSQAYTAQPDPTISFEAGRDAEYTGDVAQALDNYSQILYGKAGKETLPEKGNQ